MAHKHPIYDTDPHFKIDGDTRAIINMSDVKVALMQGDHNSERFTFEIPRYVDGHDMSLCNICQIHYLNVGSSTRATNAGIYEVEDLQFDPKDEQNRVVLSWLISSNVTMYVGSLSFVIRFGCSTDGLIDYIWNTAVCSGIMISSSICNSETVVQDYADILEQWRGKLGDSVTALKGDLSNKITKFYASNQGETHITDSDNGKIQDMMIYGKSSQDGTPTPENPVDINSVVNPVVNLTNEDGLKVQSVTLNNITLNAIPVKSGGNVTIDGKQYIADYVDVERGKLIRNILKWSPADIKRAFNNAVWHMNITSLGIDGSKLGLSNMFKIQNTSYSVEKTSELYISADGISATLNMRGMTDEEFKKWLSEKNPEVYNVLTVAEEIPITTEEALALKQLMTYYPVTNISVNSEQLDGYTVLNYQISMANGWNYVKQQLNDNRDYIYDMDIQASEAYVNSEYAVALTELEV